MALSKELKVYINKKFDEKIKELTKQQNDVAFEYAKNVKEITKSKFASFMEDKYSAFVEQLKNFIEVNEDKFSLNYDGRKLVEKDLTYFINVENPDTSEVREPYVKQIAALDKQRETLLIQLSMEKDFERIKQVLEENDIGL